MTCMCTDCLGLSDPPRHRKIPLAAFPVCHGFACGCVCFGCLKRARSPVRAIKPPVQPWQIRKAA